MRETPINEPRRIKENEKMNISVIPWHVFIDALLKQQPNTRENWLRRWLFTNEGVIMADERIATNN